MATRTLVLQFYRGYVDEQPVYQEMARMTVENGQAHIQANAGRIAYWNKGVRARGGADPVEYVFPKDGDAFLDAVRDDLDKSSRIVVLDSARGDQIPPSEQEG